MSLNYPIQNSVWKVGSASSASTLTADYADNVATMEVEGMSVITLKITYTPGQNNGVLLVQIETGDDSTDVYKQVYSDVTPDADGTEIMYIRPVQFTGATAGTVYKFKKSENVDDKFYRISFKETAAIYGTVKLKIGVSGK